MPRTKVDDNQSRQRLLDAAIKIFALHGYEGASTRQIAKEANVNISAILYYFEGKEGLYHAAMEQLADLMKTGIADRAKMVAETLANSDLSDEDCRKLLHQFMRGVIAFLLSDKVSPHAVRILVREQSEPTAVFEIFYKVMQPAQKTLRTLIGRLTGFDPESEVMVLCTHSIIGQVVVFRTHREAVLRSAKWSKIDDAAIQKISDTVLPQTDAIINHYRDLNKTGAA